MRLISTAMCAQEGSEVGKLLSPLQLAVRITDGTCIVAATAQATFTHGRAGAGCCDILKMDLKNAYGTVLRTAILRGLRKYAPGLIRWFIISYGGPTRLFHSVRGLGEGGGKAGRPNGDNPLLGGAAGVDRPDHRARARPSRRRAHGVTVGLRGRRRPPWR